MRRAAGLLQAIPEPVFSVDAEGRRVEANEAFEALGLGPREVSEAGRRPELVAGGISFRVELLRDAEGVRSFRLNRDPDSSGRAVALAAYLDGLAAGEPPLRSALTALWRGIGWRWSFVTRFNPKMVKQVQVLYWAEHGQPQEPFDYSVAGTPCERVFGDAEAGCRRFSDLPDSFPHDPWIRRVGAREYVGQVYSTHSAVPLGHLFTVTDEPRGDSETAEGVVALLGHLVSSELKALSWGALVDQATRHANQDALTGAASRYAYEQAIEYLDGPDGCRAAELGVVWLDLDRFKAVNDSLGHQEGDRLLITFAHHLASELRRTDSLFRIGGDEFVVLLPEGFDDAWLTERVARVTAVLAEHGFDGCSASYGGATAAETGGDLRAALRLADRRMYAMKQRRGDVRQSPPTAESADL